jgi:dephospho-CoA kinase
MKVVGVTGLPGSGKSVVARIAKSLGIDVIRMGDVVREEADKANEDVGEVAVKLREEYGESIIAERCVEMIKRRKAEDKTDNKKSKIPTNSLADQRIYMIEGIRSLYEVDVFKKSFQNFKVIAVYSRPESRFKRLRRRKRLDDTNDILRFSKRDQRELRFGIGDVIATSDYMVVNEGPLSRFKNIIRGLLKNEM